SNRDALIAVTTEPSYAPEFFASRERLLLHCGRDVRGMLPQRVGNIVVRRAARCLLASRVGGWLLWVRVHIDDLAGTRVVQLFARLFLDSLRIALQSLDLLSVLVVFLLESVDSRLQPLVFSAFGAVDNHSIGSKHNVQKQPEG